MDEIIFAGISPMTGVLVSCPLDIIQFFKQKKLYSIPGDDLLFAYLESCSTPLLPIVVKAIPWDNCHVHWRDFNAIIIRSSWDYHKREVEFASWLDELETMKGSVVVVNDPRIMKWNMKKTYLRDLVDKGLPKGVAFPKTLWFDMDSMEEMDNFSLSDCLKQEGMKQKVIVKPVVGAGKSIIWNKVKEWVG